MSLNNLMLYIQYPPVLIAVFVVFIAAWFVFRKEIEEKLVNYPRLANLLDFKRGKLYERKSQKVFDFIGGLVIAFITASLSFDTFLYFIDDGLSAYTTLSDYVNLIIYIIVTMFVFKKRRYLGMGMAMIIVLFPIMFVIGMSHIGYF